MAGKAPGYFSADHALYALLLVAVAFVAWSTHRYLELEQQLIKTSFELSHPQVGDWLPRTDLPILRSPGSHARIAAPERKAQVLYFFSPKCEFCKASTPHVERMHDIIRRQGTMEMYAVSMMDVDATRKYLSDTGSRIPTVALPGLKERSLYRIRVVPALLTVSKDGRVLNARYGQIMNTDVPFDAVPEFGQEDLPGKNP